MDFKNKETKTYRFEIDVITHSEKNPMISSFAEWACDRYRKEFMEMETLVSKMSMYSQMAHDCKERIQELKKEQSRGLDISILKPHELLWIKNEATRRVKTATFEGVYKCFANKFKRHDINRKQFRLIIERISKEKGDN